MSAASYRAKYGLPQRLEKGDYLGHPFRGNQYVRGRGAIAATGARELRNGGFTINPRSPSKVLRMGDDEVFIVATHPKANRQIAGTELRTQAQRREAIRQYIADHQDIIDANPDVMVGGWLHTAENGVQTVHLDLVSAFANKQQALAIGRQHGEIAIFDLKAGEDITIKKGYSDFHDDALRTSQAGRAAANRAVGKRRSDRGLLREHGLAASRDGVAKGEGPGHPFRGNQWTGGKGGRVLASGDTLSSEARSRNLAVVRARDEEIKLLTSPEYIAAARARAAEFDDIRSGAIPDDPLTVASAARIQKALGPDALVDITGMHGEYANMLANSIERTVTKYPEAGNHLRVVRIDVNNSLEHGTDAMTVFHADIPNKASAIEFVVGSVYGKQPKGTVEAAVKVAHASGWHPRGDAGAHTFDHELGHVVDYTAARKAGVFDQMVGGTLTGITEHKMMAAWTGKKYLADINDRAKANDFHTDASRGYYQLLTGSRTSASLKGWGYSADYMMKGGGFSEYIAEAFSRRVAGMSVPRPLGKLLDGLDRLLDVQLTLFKRRRIAKANYDWFDAPGTISIRLCAGKQNVIEEIEKRAFASKAQWRWAFATGQPFAHRWAHQTPGNPVGRYRRLPRNVRSSRSKANLARRKVKKDEGFTTAPMVVEQVFDVGIAKGEGPGHPFRGNQYTGGKGGVGGGKGGVSREEFIAAVTANLNKTSRTASGVSDTSSSPDKQALTATGDELAARASENFERAANIAYDAKDRKMETPEDVRAFHEEIASTVSHGLLQPGQSIYRTHETEVNMPLKQVPGALKSYDAEFQRRWNNPKEDPIAFAAWVERTYDANIHALADGSGRSTKLISAAILNRAGIKPPSYPDKKTYYREATKSAAEWESYFRSMFNDGSVKKGEGPGHPFRGNQWTGGKGGGGGRLASMMDAVAAGRPITVDPKDLSPLMLAMYARTEAAAGAGRTPPHFDLKHVSIAGVSKDNQPWSNPKNNLGLKRSEMPQVPRAGGIKAKFIDGLRARGLVKEETVNPLTLRSIQKEINGANTGRVIHAMRGGELSGDRIPVSKEGFILDGHHRVAAYVAEGKPIPIFRVDLSVTDLIAEASRMNQREGVQVRTISDLGPTVMKALAQAKARKAKQP